MMLRLRAAANRLITVAAVNHPGLDLRLAVKSRRATTGRTDLLTPPCKDFTLKGGNQGPEQLSCGFALRPRPSTSAGLRVATASGGRLKLTCVQAAAGRLGEIQPRGKA